MLAMLLKIFYGILFFFIGFYIIRFRRRVVGWTGRFMWAEKYLGNGGTYLILVLMGLFLMFLGVLYPFGGLELLVGEGNSTRININ